MEDCSLSLISFVNKFLLLKFLILKLLLLTGILCIKKLLLDLLKISLKGENCLLVVEALGLFILFRKFLLLTD
jgi:hypothetical protein